MEVNFRPETESRLQELAQQTGRAPNDLIEDAMAGYLKELSETRTMLDTRYDHLKSGRIKPVDRRHCIRRPPSQEPGTALSFMM